MVPPSAPLPLAPQTQRAERRADIRNGKLGAGAGPVWGLAIHAVGVVR